MSAADYSRHLSPFDPMLYGMLATRAMALVRLGRFEEAASWAVKAAARPNAFPHIHAIAACCLALAGALEQARAHVATVRHASPRYGLADFFTAFPFDRDGEVTLSQGRPTRRTYVMGTRVPDSWGLPLGQERRTFNRAGDQRSSS